MSDPDLYNAYLKYWNEMKNRAISGMTGFNYFSEKSPSGNIEVHFMPYRNNGAVMDGDVSLDFLNRIGDPATAEIRIAMAFWDESRIALLDKLISLVKQGAKAELVLKSNVSVALPRLEEFESKGGVVRMLNVNDNARALTDFGSRFILIKGVYDGVAGTKVAITGTLSFTSNSLRNSNSAVMLLKNAEVYNRYEAFFNDLKSLPEYRSGGPIYAGFPEAFEPLVPAEANMYYGGDKTLTLSTGYWKINASALQNTASDKKVSGYAWRSGFNVDYSIYLAMGFDVPDGASKVSFYYGSWGTQTNGAACTFQLEYSTDQGATWTQTGSVITAAAWVATQVAFDVDIVGPVRFRVHRLGQATTGAGNGRLNIDDFAIYKRK